MSKATAETTAETTKDLLVDVQGGLGLNINFANLVPELLEKYDTVSIISPYTDVFECIDDSRISVYHPNTWKAALEDNPDAFIITGRIYDTNDFIKKTTTYHDAWRVKCQLKKGDEQSLTNLKQSALKPAKKFPHLVNQVQQIQKYLEEHHYKNFILFQHTGGQSPLVQVPVKDNKPDWSQVPYNGQNNGLSRHYPTDLANEFVQKFKEKHPDTAVVSYSLPNEPYIEGTERFQVPYLVYHILADQPNCAGIVTIDSSLQHLVAGLNKPTIVLWGHTEPHTFGYENHHNIIQKCNRDSIHYFTALGPAFNKITYIKPDDLLKEVQEEIFNEKTEE
mgnify:CR=1 FL=1